jgi:hypothetical protein
VTACPAVILSKAKNLSGAKNLNRAKEPALSEAKECVATSWRQYMLGFRGIMKKVRFIRDQIRERVLALLTELGEAYSAETM